MSQQTAQLEHETFALKQQATLTAEVKSVLDSWVRHEAQVREAEQRELVQTVLANVQKQLGDKKLQRDILVAGVAEIESEFEMRLLGWRRECMVQDRFERWKSEVSRWSARSCAVVLSSGEMGAEGSNQRFELTH